MRRDNPHPEPAPEAVADPRSRSRSTGGAWPWLAAAIIAATSAVVALSVSIWLVPPYLLLMGWLLLAPSATRAAALAGPEPAGREEASAAVVEAASGAGLVAEGSSAPLEPGPDPATTAVSATTRARRGKGRGRGKLKTPHEPPAVAWVRVGPGQFVRVEGPEPAPSEPMAAPEARPEVVEEAEAGSGGPSVQAADGDPIRPGPLEDARADDEGPDATPDVARATGPETIPRDDPSDPTGDDPPDPGAGGLVADPGSNDAVAPAEGATAADSIPDQAIEPPADPSRSPTAIPARRPAWPWAVAEHWRTRFAATIRRARPLRPRRRGRAPRLSRPRSRRGTGRVGPAARGYAPRAPPRAFGPGLPG